MELYGIKNGVVQILKDKFQTSALDKLGFECAIKGNQLMLAVDRYYVIAVKKVDGQFYMRAKTVGMTLEPDWFLVLDEERLLERIVKLLVIYMMKDRDVRN